MRILTRVGLAAAVLAMAACQDVDVTELKMQIDAPVADAVRLGFVDVPGFGGTPGQHYSFWVREGDGNLVRIIRFVIVAAPEDVKALHSVIGADASQLRDFDTTGFLGYVNTQCFNGACGGIEMTVPYFVGGAVHVFITREDDDSEGETPSDDIFLTGPVQPYGRGTLRGTLLGPTGAQVPRADVTLIPEKDDAEAW